jgi:sulfite reductase (NADPH) hemoprotein beta-component
MVAKTIREFVPEHDMLSYLEAILRVYNMLGRRDNKYKARIKILLHETGVDEFTRLVEEEWQQIKDGPLVLPPETVAAIRADFAPPAYDDAATAAGGYAEAVASNTGFALWTARNVHAHKQPGYAIATVSLKPVGGIPGDATDAQMDAVADLADRFSLGEIRVSHEQNLVFAHVRQGDLHDLWRGLKAIGLDTANEGLVSDIIACPGLDYCALANARSIPISQRIGSLFADMRAQHDIGELKIKISGCINACGHHHVGHIGILGVDRRGTENYQITLGGDAGPDAAIGKIIGPGFDEAGVVDAVKTLVDTYLDIREDGERFIDTYRRAGMQPFKEAVYAAA